MEIRAKIFAISGLLYKLYVAVNVIKLHSITITRPCNLRPLTPHFYIVKLGFKGVFVFSYFCSKTLTVGTR